MENVGLAERALRLLKDSEIVAAIEKGLITLDNPDVYLRERKEDLIQPASMDLVLRSTEDHYGILGVSPVEWNRNLFQSAAEGFVTFWPGVQTETSVAFLRGYDGEVLRALPELRSTLRRVGLDIGYNPFGIGLGDDEFAFLTIRNPQNYSVSVEVGEKIAQVLWMDRGTREATGGHGLEERDNKIGTGRLVTSKKYLRELIEQGDVYLSDPESIGENGEVVFHAGTVRTYCRQGPVFIGREGVRGFELVTENALNHPIKPGNFSDIETRERIGLSGRVGMRVFYYARPIEQVSDHADLINRINTRYSSGGWIDPGYGHGKENGAPFSVQRKAFSKPIRIKDGALVAYGQVFHFPEPVEQGYSGKRGSHYNDAEGFMGPRK